MTYKVYRVIYRDEHRQVYAVAVSGSSKRAAIKRLTGNRPAEIIDTQEIPGRAPEYAQDRIEGTLDLRDELKKAPQAGTKEAEEIRLSNRRIIVGVAPKGEQASEWARMRKFIFPLIAMS